MQKWFFVDKFSFPGDHSKELETSTKASKVILNIEINFFEQL